MRAGPPVTDDKSTLRIRVKGDLRTALSAPRMCS
eukprot:CAMPEP_0184398968 /NCGR_PEP_ID=MMETSP0007-20130409/68291_1 /TAXON_ID=97485 /ORGANISM="Prymnesium parvum, Strain Texoma1" /LENGTH=33 /DNA_ID= /DNA_START= /DNA_END= /DNA_ORIENTATION=